MKKRRVFNKTLRYQTIVNGKKRCARCNEWKTLKNFRSAIGKQVTGLASSCRDCCHALVYMKCRKLKREVVKAYGGKCECCNEELLEFLTIDHINGNGKEHRESLKGVDGQRARIYKWLKSENWPKDNFRLLCMNCNFAIRLGNPCPHDKRFNNWLKDRKKKSELWKIKLNGRV